MSIPRKATKLKVTFLKDTSFFKKGDVTVVSKSDSGMWSNGKYSFFASMLRNDAFCKLEVIE